MKKGFLKAVISAALMVMMAAGVSRADTLEEAYLKNGFKSVNEAVMEIEKHFRREMKLPIKLPPVEFTHHFGMFVNDPDNFNDELEIEYLHENKGLNHYKIDVRPIEQKFNFAKLERTNLNYKLKDGTEAIYFNTKHHNQKAWFNILVFEKSGWQYILSVDNRIENKVPVEMLVEIANSIQ